MYFDWDICLGLVGLPKHALYIYKKEESKIFYLSMEIWLGRFFLRGPITSWSVCFNKTGSSVWAIKYGLVFV